MSVSRKYYDKIIVLFEYVDAIAKTTLDYTQRELNLKIKKILRFLRKYVKIHAINRKIDINAVLINIVRLLRRLIEFEQRKLNVVKFTTNFFFFSKNKFLFFFDFDKKNSKNDIIVNIVANFEKDEFD